MTRLIAVGDP